MSDVVIDLRQLDLLQRSLARASNAGTDQLLDDIGQQQEDSARRRIQDTKRAPDGTPWDAWSDRYAATRGSEHSLLRGDTGALVDSLTHNPLSDGVEIGSNLAYAGVLFEGSEDGTTPARPALDFDGGGLSDPDDRDDIQDLVRDFAARLLS